ncbi:type VI secretion system-associated FHA domain protein [Chondromyces crocatus]|uniref:Phosphopeptide-binding protein n=1 Tax=Chondromyces crocatus TaxID=52 RepID=A0A0K1EDE1_CHOCO|nr:type VI secretion system-associated FHA domain protein [Chondromyces crocatus]AKT38896.1 phosphopeptide-binding protein [Chondromyces crocatus]
MPVALTARVIDTQANDKHDYTFERFPVRIGRNQLNDLHIDRPYVSQFHAAIDVRDRQLFVRDLGSTNGTVFAGHRLARDTPVEITQTPEITIGPIVIRLSMVEAAPKKREEIKEGTVLDYNVESAGLSALMAQRSKQVAPGAEDAYVRQLVPYIEAYRASWGAVYRVIYDHLARLPPEVRQNYLRRLCQEHQNVTIEPDFQKISQYYGVDSHAHGELRPADAALVALAELARSLAPGTKVPDDVAGILTFARRLRDTMEVFMKCFVSLRDGYQEFEAEVLARERASQEDRVATAKDAKELGALLLSPAGGQDAARHLYDIFVDVMSHQVALLNGVMEGVKSLLVKLSPKAIEDELERRGKKGGLFSTRYEELWKLYELRHGDYSGEDKETFLIIFGPQFSRAYAATAGEDYSSSGEAAGKNLSRFSINVNPVKR